MMRYAGRLLAMAPALVAGLALSVSVQARDLRYATGYPPNSIGADAAQVYADAVKKYSDGKLGVKVYPLSLLNFLETAPGIRDGITDSGFVLLPYFPNEFPSSNLVAELSQQLELTDVSPDSAGLAFAGAFSEYVFHHCPECVSEFAQQNQVFTSGTSSPPYYLLCNKPVTNLDQIKGKRLRSGGAQWARWAAAMGATPVTMSVNELYDGMSQGVLDCSMQSAPELSIFSLFEVTTDITLAVPGGVFGGTAANNVSTDVWKKFSEKGRSQFLRAAAVMSAELTWQYTQGGINNLKTARDGGKIKVHEAGMDLVDATREFIQKDAATIPATYRERYGIKRADEMVKTFQPILERWVGLVQGVKTPEELAELYWNETFSKVDVSKYAL